MKNYFLKNIPHELSDASKQLTVSIGIATVSPKKNEDTKVLYLMADKELYKAKAKGRNTTSVYTDNEDKLQ